MGEGQSGGKLVVTDEMDRLAVTVRRSRNHW